MTDFVMLTMQAADIPSLVPVMTRAFDYDSLKGQGHPGGPPGYADGSFLRQWAFAPGATAFRIDVDGHVAGAAIIWLHPESSSNILGCIFLDVPYQGNGLGTKIWKWLETNYPAKKWEVETPSFSRTNHHFYVNKCGFAIYRIDDPKSPEFSIYKMHKFYPEIREAIV